MPTNLQTDGCEVKYQVGSSQEITGLEKLMKSFWKNYDIDFETGDTIYAKYGFLYPDVKVVEIAPCKPAKISAVCIKKNHNPDAKLWKSGPEFVTVLIGNCRYIINYTSNE